MVLEEDDDIKEKKAPRISIGLAVYNGERHLEKAIESILNQTFTDFELIISDNASTDSTPEICKRYALKDSRIRYSRNQTNIGGANNENLTFMSARGAYFRWAAHDDVVAPRFLEICCNILDAHPDVVLCHTQTVIIDEFDDQKNIISRNKATSARPSERFAELTPLDHDCEETYGLMRSVVLQQTGLQRNYTDSDRTLLAHLSLLGKYHQVAEPLFFKRIHAEMSTQVYADWRQRMGWFGEEYRDKVNYPYFLQFWHYLTIISSAPISGQEKFRCYRHMAYWILRYRRWQGVGQDVVFASFGKLRRLARRCLSVIVSH